MGDPKERRRGGVGDRLDRRRVEEDTQRSHARARAAADDEEDTWVAIVQFREAAAKLIFGRHFRCSYIQGYRVEF